jgi:tetratricopeptide (TPR) repeat protein
MALSGRISSVDREEVSRLLDLGDFYFRSENYLAALESYGRVPTLLPRTGSEVQRGLLEIKLAQCHRARGNYQLALEHLDRAKSDLRSKRDSIQLGKLYGLRGNILLEMGRYVRAQRYCELAHKLLRGTGENATLGELELALGTIWARLGDGNRAREFFTSALSTYRRIDDESGIARALNNLGLQSKNACEWREAVRCLNGALELSEKNAVAKLSALIRLNLGIVHFKLGDWSLAEEFLNKSRKISSEIGHVSCLVRNQIALGNLDRRRRRWNSARELYETALELSEQNNYSREIVLAMEFMGELMLDQEKFEEASELLQKSLERAEEIAPLGDLVNEVCRRLGESRLGEGRYDEALALGQRALSCSSKINDQYERAITCRLVGLAYSMLGRSIESEQFLGEAVDSLTRIGETFELGRTLLKIGSLPDQPEGRGADLMKQAFGIFLSLDSRGYAAIAAYEVARHHCANEHLDEAILFLDRAMGLTSESEEPELWGQILRLRREVENAYAARWMRAGGGIDSFKELARLFDGGSDVATALTELVRLGVQRSQSDRGFVAFGDSPAALRLFGLFGMERAQADRIQIRLARAFKDALIEGRPVIVSQAGADPRFTSEGAGLLREIRSFALLPLALPAGGPGVLYIDRLDKNPVGNFNQADLNLLTLVCNLAALSILEHQRKELLQENRSLKIQLWNQPYPEIVTQNPRMIEILRMAEKVGDCAASILVEGETGTGKGLIAQAIHNHSRRHDKPFIQVNCAALPEQLLESELFGHVQ